MTTKKSAKKTTPPVSYGLYENTPAQRTAAFRLLARNGQDDLAEILELHDLREDAGNERQSGVLRR